VTQKYELAGKKVTIAGLNRESQTIVDRVGLSASSPH
jgi:hypothetical protein